MICGFRKMNLEDRRKWQHKFYNYWQDTLEVRLEGVKAAKAKLEEAGATEELS